MSAQAAFYGLSSALLPESDFYKNKQKFLEVFEKEALLNRSYFNQLGRFISGELLKNSLETYSNLDYSKGKFISNLTISAYEEINQFKSDLSGKMYTHIERDIEDDGCKKIFKDEFLQGMGKLREDIKERFEKGEEQFRKDIQKDIRQFEDNTKKSLAYLKRTNIDRGFDFDFSINTDSGIDKIGLLASMGGLGFGLLNFWNPAGWILMALGLVGIVKSLWNFFSPSYKQSQQKKQWIRV
ncbi:hypothetical protein ID0090_03380 [Helicobacter pylori]